MSVPNQTPYNIYTANGLSTVFAYEFYLISASDIQVTINGSEVSSGYTVSGVGNTRGGEVTFLTAPANGATVIFERVTPTYRLTDYQDNGDLLADTVNKDFDRLWMAIQRAFIYLGVALSRPLFGGGPFNANWYRIANLAEPVNPFDAANKIYVDNSINSNEQKWTAGDEALNKKINDNFFRTLRVGEAFIPEMPPLSNLEGKLLAISGGRPVGVLPESGSASDVMIELAKKDGYTKIGNFFSGEGYESVGDINQSAWERIFKRGEFEIHQMPGDPAGVAGIVFGGPNNKAAVVVDERGRIQTYAIVDGKLSAAQVGTPIVQGTGYFHNGFEDRIIRFPSAGGESDDLTPGILITTNDNGICDFFVVSPNQFNDLGKVRISRSFLPKLTR